MSNVAQQPIVAPTNRLLSQLPVHERNAIHRGSEMIFFNVGDIVLHAHAHSSYVFFPVEAVVSVVRTLREERSVELGLIGNEGMIGLDVIMEAKTQIDDTVVQNSGSALRMPAVPSARSRAALRSPNRSREPNRQAAAIHRVNVQLVAAHQRHAHLLGVTQACRAPRIHPCLSEDGEENGSENGYNCDNDEKLDERKGRS